jgi:hypothetical protein
MPKTCAAALVLLLAAGCEFGNGDVPRAAPAERTAGESGVTVRLPRGWHTVSPESGIVDDPKTRIVASSAPIRLRSVACQIARYAPPPDGVTLVVVEWEQSDAFGGPRPKRFTSRKLRVQAPPVIECFGGAGGSVQFQEAGRVFGAYLLLGHRAPVELADEARAVLDTLVVRASTTFGRPAKFSRLPSGWRHRDSGVAIRHPGGLNTWTEATSWPYRPDSFGPVRRIPRDGILIEVLLIRRSGFPRSLMYPALTQLPFRLEDAEVSTEEGAPHIAQYRLLYRYGRQYDVDLRVDFGRPRPTQAMRAEAQRALNALVLPKWSP